MNRFIQICMLQGNQELYYDTKTESVWIGKLISTDWKARIALYLPIILVSLFASYLNNTLDQTVILNRVLMSVIMIVLVTVGVLAYYFIATENKNLQPYGGKISKQDLDQCMMTGEMSLRMQNRFLIGSAVLAIILFGVYIGIHQYMIFIIAYVAYFTFVYLYFLFRPLAKKKLYQSYRMNTLKIK